MSANLNKVFLIGNVTRDPELRDAGGTPVCDLGLAVNERQKDASGQWTETTVFVTVSLWARTAEVAAEFLSKGSPVLIEGRLKLDQWEQDGQKRSKLKVVGERMQMLGRSSEAPAVKKPSTPQYSQPQSDAGRDDVPF